MVTRHRRHRYDDQGTAMAVVGVIAFMVAVHLVAVVVTIIAEWSGP